VAAVSRRLDELAEDPPPAPPRAPAAPPPASPPGAFGEHREPVAWAVATGRVGSGRAQFWESQLREERSRTGSAAARTEATLLALHPVYDVGAPRRPAVSESETPLLDEFDEAMYGPSEKVRRRRDDLAAEAWLAEDTEREREAAAQPGLTEEERRALFGPDEQD
jgi:hypothetical protein